MVFAPPIVIRKGENSKKEMYFVLLHPAWLVPGGQEQ